jgi:hypothetical protein
MKDASEKSSKEQPPLDIQRWQTQDIYAMEIRTEQDPQFFTPHLARLRVLGLALSDPKRLLILAFLAEEDRLQRLWRNFQPPEGLRKLFMTRF